jgi:hypothetical protein
MMATGANYAMTGSIRQSDYGGDCFQIPFRVALPDVERKRGILSRHLSIVRKQVRARGTAEAIQNLRAGALD